jgi:hypothetical protein
MENFKNICFICSKPSVVYYDFAVIETSHVFQKTVRHTQTHTTQRIAGIVRLALCKDCLSERLDRHIQENTNQNSKPKIGKKKFVELCMQMRQRLNTQDYTKTLDMQILFYTSLSPFQEMISFDNRKPLWDCFGIALGNFAVRNFEHLGDKFLAKAPDKVKAHITSQEIDANFVLISMEEYAGNNPQPFTKAIKPALPHSYYMLYFAEYLDQLSETFKIPKDLHPLAVALKNDYISRYI